MSKRLTEKEVKIGSLVLLTGIAALAHYIIPTDRHDLHMVHIVLRKLYFLPPVVAAVWFGFRGSVYTTIAVSTFFPSTHFWIGRGITWNRRTRRENSSASGSWD